MKLEEIEKEALCRWYPRLHEIDLLDQKELFAVRCKFNECAEEEIGYQALGQVMEVEPIIAEMYAEQGIAKITIYHMQNLDPMRVDEYVKKHRRQLKMGGIPVNFHKLNKASSPHLELQGRNDQIVRMRRRRMKYTELSERFGLTASRCFQIFNQHRFTVPDEYSCKDCHTRFTFTGDFIDALCPDCKSIHINLD